MQNQRRNCFDTLTRVHNFASPSNTTTHATTKQTELRFGLFIWRSSFHLFPCLSDSCYQPTRCAMAASLGQILFLGLSNIPPYSAGNGILSGMGISFSPLSVGRRAGFYPSSLHPCNFRFALLLCDTICVKRTCSVVKTGEGGIYKK